MSQAGAIGRQWYSERESDSGGRKKSRIFARTVCRTGCNLLSGSFQRWLVTAGSSGGPPPVPAAAVGKVLQERSSQGLEGRGRGQKKFCRERVMLSLELLTGSPRVRWPQQEGSALGEEGRRGTIMLKNDEAAEKPSRKKLLT